MSKQNPARLLNRLPSARVARKATTAKPLTVAHRTPTDAAGWLALGRQLCDAGQHDQARDAAEQARTLSKDPAPVWLLLAQIEVLANNIALAIGHFRKAIELDGQQIEAHHGLASALLRTDELDDALKHVDLALKLEPGRLNAKALKALILTRLHRQAEAIELLQNLIVADPRPDAAHAHLNNLGNAQRDIGRLADAERSYRKALQHQPLDVNSQSNLLSLLHYMPEKTAAEIEAACREIGALFAKDAKSTRPVPRDKSPDKRLRVGMFSDGFRQHPVGAMTATALEQLVKQGVEIYAYSTSAVSDYITHRIKGFCTRWQVVTYLTDEQFIEQIREDEIDILIDLAGYGAGTHMRALTHEPAPLIVKWVGGLINTTGIESIDYLITDAVESPPGVDTGFTEKLIRMPDDYICYMPPSHVPAVGPLPALQNGYVTFGCFNNPTKINPVVLTEWAHLLNAVPGSRLLLKSGPYDSPVMQRMVLDTMQAHGVDEDRIRFSGHSIHHHLLRAYNEVDVALDPWPYSGGLTTCEAMIMGVPVVTLPGPTFAGRHSATHLVNAGMPDLVAGDWDEYRARAVALVSDLDNLATIRGNLRKVLLESPVCDGARYAGNMANALRAIWQRYCEGKAPAALYLDKNGGARFEGETDPVKLVQPALPPEEIGFQWALQGKLIAVDSGGRLLDRPSTEGMVALRMLEAVVFDAKGDKRDHVLTQREGVHYLNGLALGNGEPATLNECLDPKLSGLLRPLDADSADPLAGGRVLFQRPMQTTALDNINGLPTIDWLLLDAEGPSATILAHGSQALAKALVIDARVVFHATHVGQPMLAELESWALSQGFRLHCLHHPEVGHASGLAGSQTLPPTALLRADAIFVPTPARLALMDAASRQKLACILHLGYGFEDATYEILATDSADDSQAQAYLDDRYIAKAIGRDMVLAVHNARNRNEAVEAVHLARSLPRWSEHAIEVLIKRCVSMLAREPRNDTAYFLLSHALLGQGELGPCDDDTPNAALLRDLSVRLNAEGYPRKGYLYSFWLADAQVLRNRAQAKVSVILVADRVGDHVPACLATLREQSGDDLEVVLLSNGAPRSEFDSVLHLLDAYIETRGGAGECLARNLAVLYTNAPILLFLDARGLPEPGLIQAHIDAHNIRDAVAVRGGCRTTGGGTVPAHWDLGAEIIPSLPTLEGNVSFSRKAFSAAQGWGDYLLGEHAGTDIGNRLINLGYEETRLVYTPGAVLRLDQIPDPASASDKYAAQRAPWLLLEAWGTTKASPPAKQLAPASTSTQRPLPTLTDTGKKYYLHICYNNMHVQGLINMLDDASLGDAFVHQIFIERERSVDGYDNDIQNNEHAYFFDKRTDFQKIVDLCLRPGVQGVFVHGLFFDWQKSLVKAIGPRAKVIWGIWGGDLYGPINAGKPLFDIVEHVDAVASVTEGDYRLFCNTYGEKPRLQIMYPPALDLETVPVPDAKSNVIFVGNSGDAGNLHGEILEHLAGKSDIKDYEIILPLSYNVSNDYKQSLIRLIQKLNLTRQTRLLTDFIPLAKYTDMLANAKFLITAHNRQQALGNMVTALYFGAGTVLRKNILVDGAELVNPSWEILTQMQTQPLSYEAFAACTRLADLPLLSREQADSQRAALQAQISRSAILRLLKSQFELAAQIV
ncbi:TDP-N-acetylfucosamine:lipid II N-acetylfucosaminyltransferase [Achromobacter aloeverae]|uniref:protein O-GlcNAc transferase n=1 Tax=Achromobacter aloeverae TaxID=1750518 RepID=A0A4Q1HNJ3_9BURK|nr:TDP-N-acetylfucosamine:lipid II N-acetylfucosaminyltransferase [Achromobacter aloeverae]RXN92592.1 hypothetical protein C7R54_02210 [Achromobacter aloeverae]